MLTPLTENQKTRLVNNIVAAATLNVEKLNKQSYKFLHLANGFIAHYSIWGFMDHYAESGKLRRDILDNQRSNQWSNFRPLDKDYDYYMAKKDVYNRICEKLWCVVVP